MIIMIGIVSVLVAGVCQLASSNQTLAHTDADYAAALNNAEAGINTELAKISRGITPDQQPTTYQLPVGTYTVWVTQRNADGSESSPWTEPENLYVYCTGTVDGTSRTVKVAVKSYPITEDYAIYTTGTGITNSAGSAPIISGDVGTNGQLAFAGTPTVEGDIVFNGEYAGWARSDPGGYNVSEAPRSMEWDTVSEIALERFPNGGLTYLKFNNNNANANPPIIGNTINRSTTLTAGDYYVERMTLTGTDAITFDNTNGPVNIWVGPYAGMQQNTFRGGTTAVPVSVNPAHRPAIYVATKGAFNVAGDNQIDALIYAHNETSSGAVFGNVILLGSPTINGQIVAGSLDIRGQPRILWHEDLEMPLTPGYYGYDTSWIEVIQNSSGQWVEGSRLGIASTSSTARDAGGTTHTSSY
jgi:hypothetical protein